VTDPGSGPQDRQLDRRSFLGRMAALSAAASAGAFAVPVRPAAATAIPVVSLPDLVAASSAPPSVTTIDLASLVGTIRPAALGDAVELTAAEAVVLMRRRALSPLELVDAYLERIRRFEGVYLAFNEVLADSARSEARRLTDAAPTGLLYGVPLAVKDNFYTAGIRTTANSLIFADFVPTFDATAVARLRSSGGIVLGKMQMGPLATTRATTPAGEVTTVNAWAPHEPSVSPGGSSSGSATAVAARLAASATGTQTGGSITAPANAQGLTGLKPTLGRVSLYGIIPLTYTRDHPGPIARDAVDAALLLQAMAGPDPRDPRTLGLPPAPNFLEAVRPLRRMGRVQLRWPTTIGVPPGYAGGDGAAASAQRQMLATFEELGARVVEVRMPPEWAELGAGLFNEVRLVERAEPFLEHLRHDVRGFGVSLSSWINGLFLSGDEYLKGQRARLLLLRHVLDDVFAQCDVLAQPSHLPFDMIGLPLIAFPVGMSGGANARPLGAILGGQPFAEDRLLSMVAAYQAVTNWHDRRPPDPLHTATAASPVRFGAAASTRGRILTEQVPDLSE
jgi:Asp-tRNA(Asn)/Glu-tRNA(Gln) amidotransferase A subunit family amidase